MTFKSLINSAIDAASETDPRGEDTYSIDCETFEIFSTVECLLLQTGLSMLPQTPQIQALSKRITS